VSIPMDFLSADLPVDAFSQLPAEIARPTIDRLTAERIVDLLASAAGPVIYVGGGVISARATDELTALAEALEIPVAHSLMGKGAMHEAHPLLLGMTGFWGTPLANEMCRNADVMLAVGTRLAEASSSSWDPRFTFAPQTRVIHIDADLAEIGRNLPTELGVTADAKLALGALADVARGRSDRPRGDLRGRIREGRTSFSSQWAPQWRSGQFPMRPERILGELRAALPEDGFVVTDVGWNKNGVAQQFAITVPGTFVTPSGLATMGFGPSAVLGVKMAQPHRAAVALIGDGGFGSNPSVIATAMEAKLPVVWLVMDNAAFGTIAGLEQMHYGNDFGCVFECDGKRPYRVDFAAMARACGANGVMITAADELGPALRNALAADRPTVIQAPMENAPTPTPGHWNINDIYRVGE
jgi:acetolactate synthase I/II/III large subunit